MCQDSDVMYIFNKEALEERTKDLDRLLGPHGLTRIDYAVLSMASSVMSSPKALISQIVDVAWDNSVFWPDEIVIPEMTRRTTSQSLKKLVRQGLLAIADEERCEEIQRLLQADPGDLFGWPSPRLGDVLIAKAGQEVILKCNAEILRRDGYSIGPIRESGTAHTCYLVSSQCLVIPDDCPNGVERCIMRGHMSETCQKCTVSRIGRWRDQWWHVNETGFKLNCVHYGEGEL